MDSGISPQACVGRLIPVWGIMPNAHTSDPTIHTLIAGDIDSTCTKDAMRKFRPIFAGSVPDLANCRLHHHGRLSTKAHSYKEPFPANSQLAWIFKLDLIEVVLPDIALGTYQFSEAAQACGYTTKECCVGALVGYNITSKKTDAKVLREDWNFMVVESKDRTWCDTYGAASARRYWGRLAALLIRLGYQLHKAFFWIMVLVDEFRVLLDETGSEDMVSSKPTLDLRYAAVTFGLTDLQLETSKFSAEASSFPSQVSISVRFAPSKHCGFFKVELND